MLAMPPFLTLCTRLAKGKMAASLSIGLHIHRGPLRIGQLGHGPCQISVCFVTSPHPIQGIISCGIVHTIIIS
eukprot:4278789-Prorocentrum_lima.AAC.1